MGLAGVWGLVPKPTVRVRDRRAEGQILQEAGLAVMRFSSMVSLCPPSGLVLEIGRSLRLFGGLNRLLGRLEEEVARRGFEHVMAVAPTPLAAALLAIAKAHPAKEGGKSSRAPARLTKRSALPGMLAWLPLAIAADPSLGAEGIGTAGLESLEKLGLTTLGDCLDLPRTGLNRRVSGVLSVLDRALGALPDPRPRLELPPGFEIRLAFPSPVAALEGLLFGINRLLQGLAAYLEARAFGATALRLALRAESGASGRLARGLETREQEIIIRLASASRDPALLLMLTRERLERLERTGFSWSVAEVTLSVPEMQPLAPGAPELFPTDLSRPDSPAPEEDSAIRLAAASSLPRLIERLEARLGPGRILYLESRPDHRPERAWVGRCPVEYPEPSKAGGLGSGPDIPAPASRKGARPLWLVADPSPLELIGGLPAYRGRVLRIVRGPERIESGWWDGADIFRDYYVARSTDGQTAWIFEERRGPGQWYLHGFFG